MKGRGNRPLYLARRTYRRRRLMDAARLLPLVGAFLFALPVLWAPAEAPESATAQQGIYLFCVWALLIAAALALARKLRTVPEDEPDPEPD